MAVAWISVSILVLGVGAMHEGAGAGDETCPLQDYTCMLQYSQPAPRRGDQSLLHSNAAFSCAALTHQGGFSTVDIAVGTPPQMFSVVADTGSDSVIIPSCVCQDLNNCHPADRCFTGTGQSSTFSIQNMATGPPNAVLTFGSGPIKVAVSSDVVRVGDVAQQMEDGVLLMVDQQLDFGGSFEGILGLGLPTNAWPAIEAVLQDKPIESAESLQDIVQRVMDGSQEPQIQYALVANLSANNGDSSKFLKAEAKQVSRHDSPNVIADDATNNNADPATYEEKGFLESAGVSRFSLCFNHDSAGALRLNPPAAEHTLGNVGHDHWAVDFRGVSIGGSAERLGFCGVEGMRAGQETPCAGIPDSGTTLTMAPQEHIDALFQSLCDGWDRCRQHHTAIVETSSAAGGAASKAELFQFLLSQCEGWMDEKGLDELPSINFILRGSDGSEQEVKLPGWAYVIATPTAGGAHVCEAAFSAMDYDTVKNGPVWIFGSPFFFTHEVGYDLQTSPPGISFTSIQDSSCGSCEDGNAAALVSGSTGTVTAVDQRHRRPRIVDGPRRGSSIDTNKPL